MCCLPSLTDRNLFHECPSQGMVYIFICYSCNGVWGGDQKPQMTAFFWVLRSITKEMGELLNISYGWICIQILDSSKSKPGYIWVYLPSLSLTKLRQCCFQLGLSISWFKTVFEDWDIFWLRHVFWKKCPGQPSLFNSLLSAEKLLGKAPGRENVFCTCR